MRHIVAAAALLALVGCHHEKAATNYPTQTTQAQPSMPEMAPATAPASMPMTRRSCSVDTDCPDQQLCSRNECVDITAGLAECQMFRVHFAFDSAQIQDDDVPKLTRIARCLKADQTLDVRIEGNADERGSEMYTLALGDRRATSVAKRLQSLGVSQMQLSTVSYGKDKPLCVEHDEPCWSKNRRASVKPKQEKTRSH